MPSSTNKVRIADGPIQKPPLLPKKSHKWCKSIKSGSQRNRFVDALTFSFPIAIDLHHKCTMHQTADTKVSNTWCAAMQAMLIPFKLELIFSALHLKYYELCFGLQNTGSRIKCSKKNVMCCFHQFNSPFAISLTFPIQTFWSNSLLQRGMYLLAR